MLYKANKNFVGVVTMRKGEVREIEDAKAVNDLLALKLIEPANVSEAKKSQADAVTEAKPETKRGRKPKTDKEG